MAIRHIHLVSDATGETINSIARSCLVQLEGVEPIEHVWSLIRTKGQMQKCLDGIRKDPGPVLYTVIDPTLTDQLLQGCQRIPVPCIPPLEPTLYELAAHLDVDLNIAGAPLGLVVDPKDRIRLSAERRRPRVSAREFTKKRQLSLDALTELQDLLTACRPADAKTKRGDNRLPIPLTSELFEQILAEVRAGIALHEAPRPDAARLMPLWRLLSKLANALKPFTDEFLKYTGAAAGLGGGFLITDFVAKMTGASDRLYEFISLLLG